MHARWSVCKQLRPRLRFVSATSFLYLSVDDRADFYGRAPRSKLSKPEPTRPDSFFEQLPREFTGGFHFDSKLGEKDRKKAVSAKQNALEVDGSSGGGLVVAFM